MKSFWDKTIMKNLPLKKKSRQGYDRWAQINWIMIILLACIGFAAVGLISVGFTGATTIYRKYFPLADATMEMRMEAITAYLWFEEMLGGDESTTFKDILRHLDQADWYAKAMIEGGENDHVKLSATIIPHLHKELISLQQQLGEQRKLLNKRVMDISKSKPGSEIDKVYHSILENFLEQSKSFEMNVKGLMAYKYQSLKLIWFGVLACCLILFFFAGFVFYRYERLRRNHYLEMIKMQRRMIHTEKMAALGTMIAGVAHEVNNPNNFISFNTPILKEYIQELLPIVDEHAKRKPNVELMNMPYSEFREDLHKILGNIENGSIRINRIVSDLKDFARKKDKTKADWISLDEVIERSATICKAKIKDSIDSFDVNISDNLPQLYCDPEIVEMIIINFLINAAEAADKKNSWIELKVYLGKKEQNFVIIEVNDNGSGIEKNNLDKIFDPFFSTKSSKGGTGMGLYLCDTLAAQIGAYIDIESEFGKGSTFRLIIRADEVVGAL